MPSACGFGLAINKSGKISGAPLGGAAKKIATSKETAALWACVFPTSAPGAGTACGALGFQKFSECLSVALSPGRAELGDFFPGNVWMLGQTFECLGR